MSLPISFRPIVGIGEIFKCQPVKFLMLSQCLYDVPAEAVYTDPPAFDPALLRLGYECDKPVIIKIMNIDIILAEIHNCNLTFLM